MGRSYNARMEWDENGKAKLVEDPDGKYWVNEYHTREVPFYKVKFFLFKASRLVPIRKFRMWVYRFLLSI